MTNITADHTEEHRDLPTFHPLPEGFRETIRQLALTRFKQHCVYETAELGDPEGDSKIVHAYWMSLIMVANSSIKVMFKAHYNVSEMKVIAKDSIEKNEKGEITDIAAADFMREYANLVGGVVKATLETVGIAAGVSLPLVTRGFDEIFVNFNKATSNYIDRFQIRTSDGSVFCSFHVECNDASVIDLITKVPAPTQDDTGGDVEFL
ncbi:MAG TPA: hypothetical protein PLU50_04980 [Pseudobdellovibrionaceae bacterium]|nr:hypothetical protein [Pseudobdellovibrionaceae bacterium]